MSANGFTTSVVTLDVTHSPCAWFGHFRDSDLKKALNLESISVILDSNVGDDGGERADDGGHS